MKLRDRLLLSGAVLCYLMVSESGLAQITPDDTLGGERSRVTPNINVRGAQADRIDGGATRGANLFHSFREFNVNEGQRVYFSNPVGIQNILSRVTGTDVSDILGTLGVDGGANLFLLNPNGIIFGPNARLDISGSFTASTGDRFTFPDGSEFSAANPQAPPLLTINVTPGLQYGRPAGNLSNAGSLSVGAGQSLTLFGNTVTTTGSLVAPGGTVQVLGDRVGLLDNAQIDVASETGGGTVLVGGDYQGQGTVPNALRTYFAPTATINADALTNGTGGRVIVWADDVTGFYGSISARGGNEAGNGGFVEVSGSQHLLFDGIVDVGAPQGSLGTLLLDPRNITISSNTDSSNQVDSALLDSQILYDDNFDTKDNDITINAATLQALDGNIILQATRNITVANSTSLNFVPGGSITFAANSDGGNRGDFSMQAGQSINTNGRAITISGNVVTLGLLNTRSSNTEPPPPNSDGNAGSLTVNARDDIRLNGNVTTTGNQTYNRAVSVNGSIQLNAEAGTIAFDSTLSAANNNLTLTANEINFGGNVSGTGNLTLQPSTVGQAIALGATDNTTPALDLTNAEIGRLQNGFNSITIGTTGTLGVGGNVSFNDPVTLRGGTINVQANVAMQGNNLALEGDEIDLAGAVSGTGNLRIQPVTASQAIALGATDNNTPALDLTSTEIANLQNGFSLIAIGRSDSTGAVTLNPVIFNDPVAIAGGSTLTGANQTTTWTITGNNTGTLTGFGEPIQFSNIGNLVGGTADDSFTLNGGTLTGSIDGGTGTDTLTGGNVDNTFILTAADAGTATGVGTGFTSIENLTGGNATDTVTFNGGSLSGTINGSTGNLTLQGDEIDLTGAVSGTGDLLIQPLTPSQAIALGATDNNTPALDLTDTDIASLQDGFNSITIGTTGTLGVGGNIGFNDSVTLRGGIINVQANVAMQGNNLTLEGDEIDLTGAVSGTGNLRIQPLTLSQAIALGATDNTTLALDLTSTEIANLQDGFSSITIGRSDSTGAVTLNPVTFNDPVAIAGGSTLTGANQTTTWTITGNNAGTLTGFGEPVQFSNIENLVGGTGTDTLIGGNVDSTFTITGTDSGTATGTGGFSNIENLGGGTANDSFTLNGGTLTGSIDGGTGTDTLTGGNVDNTFTLTAANTGTATGVGTGFTSIENLTGGNATDTVTFNGGSLSGTINGSTGNLTLQGDEIDLTGAVSGTGDLLIQPITLSQAIALGSSADSGTTTLDLLSNDLNALQNGFTSITIGRSDGTGNISIPSAVNFSDPVTLLTSGSIQVNDSVSIPTANSITLQASQVDLNTGGALTARSGQVNLLGNTIQLNGGSINVSGLDEENKTASSGGTVRIGNSPTTDNIPAPASFVFIDPNASIDARGQNGGNDGRVIIRSTFPLIPSLQNLNVGTNGTIDINGSSQPTNNFQSVNIEIVDGSIAPLFDSITQTLFLAETSVETLANFELNASNNFTIRDLTDNELNYSSGSGSVRFSAGAAFSMASGDTIRTNGNNIAIAAGTITLGNINTSLSGNRGGDIDLIATGDINLTNSRLTSENSGTGFSRVWVESTGGSVTLNNTDINAANPNGFQGDSFAGDILINGATTVQIGNSRISTNGNRGRIFIGASDIDSTDLTFTTDPIPQRVEIQNSQLTTSNSNIGGTQAAGSISIVASNTPIQNQGIAITNSQLATNTVGSGAGGVINLNAGTVTVSTSFLDASTSGSGLGGNIAIRNAANNSDPANPNGRVSLTNSFITTRTNFDGQSGNITIDAGSVALTNNSSLDANTSGRGNGGNITVTTQNTNPDNFAIALDNSTISAIVDSGATGQGGNIAITTDSLSLTNGARIQAQTRGIGSVSNPDQARAGNITINFDRQFNISGANRFGLNSGVLASSDTPTSGTGGNITINTPSTPRGDLTLSQQGFISAGTRSTANGGTIDINVNHLTLQTGGQILSSASNSGNAGNIAINSLQGVSITGSGTGGSGTSGSEIPPSDSDAFQSINLIPLAFGPTIAPDNLQTAVTTEASYANTLRPTTQGDEFDYYSFEVETGNSQGIFDIDSASFDTELFLFNRFTGEVLASNDDSSIELGAGGSDSSLDSYIDYTFDSSGRYVIGVGRFNSFASNGSISGNTPTQGQTYTLRVSLENQGGATFNPADLNPNEGLNSAILAQATGSSNAGNLSITAPSLEIDPQAQISAQTVSGAGGNITLTGLTDLNVTNNQILASTQTGTAGNINVSASGTVTLSGQLNGQGAGLLAQATGSGQGDAGNVTINASNLVVENGAQVTASTVDGTAGSINIAGAVVNGVETTAASVRLIDGDLLVRATGQGNAGNVSVNTQNLTLESQSTISAQTVSGTGRDITLTGLTDLNVTNSQVSASTQTGTAGSVNVSASGTVTLSGQLNGQGAGLLAQATGSGQGDAGNVTINASNLVVENGAQVTASTVDGTAGSINIAGAVVNGVETTAASVRLIDGDLLVRATGQGNAGNVSVNTQNLTLESQSTISAQTVSGTGRDITLTGLTDLNVTNSQVSASTQTGTAGSVNVSASGTVTLSGQLNGQGAGLLAQATGSGQGDAGNVTINASNLVVENGAQVTASTVDGTAGSINIAGSVINGVETTAASVRLTDGDLLVRATGQGSAGNVSVNTQSLTLDRQSTVSAQTVSGTGGDITLTGLNDLNVTNSQISASTQAGTAGNVTVTAANSVQLDGTVAGGRPGGILAQATNGGRAGDVTINITNPSGQLTIKNGAEVTARSVIEGEGISSGAAGNLTVSANTVTLNNGSLNVETEAGIGGNIAINNLNSLTATANSEISANTTTGTAGSISINSNGAPASEVTLQGSRIEAQATGDSSTSRAGNITVNAQDVDLSENSRIATSNVSSAVPQTEQANFGNIRLDNTTTLSVDNSLISTSTQRGVAGSVSINATDSVTLTGDGDLTDGDRQGIIAEATNGGTAGSISIATPQLDISNGASVAVSSANGGSTAGNITIDATTVDLSGGAAIAAETDAGGAISPANITLRNLEQLTVNNSIISSSTSSGTAGNITVDASQAITLSGTFVDAEGRDRGGIIAEATNGGNAGAVTLTTPLLTVNNGARVSTTIAGNNPNASAGNVTVNARNITLSGATSGLFAETTGAGNAGSLTINPNTGQALTINFAGGAGISASTSGPGNGGDLILNGRDSIELRGNGRVTVASTGTGNAGELQLNTNQLILENGVEISASTITSDGSVVSVIDLDQPLELINTRINASTVNGNAGGLIVRAPSIRLSGIFSVDGVPILDRNGRVQAAGLFAEATGSGNAGFISISTPGNFVIENGAQATISTELGIGKALAIVARSIELRNPVGETRTETGLFARSGSGTSGNVTLSNLNTVTIQDGAQLSTTTASGQAGNININSFSPNAAAEVPPGAAPPLAPETPAASIIVQGNGSSLSAQANQSRGRAGDVILNVESLTVENGGNLSASNINSNEGGSVTLNQLDSLQVRSGGVITAETQTGVAGDVQVNAADGTVQLTGDNTRLTARANGVGGRAGDVNVTANQVIVENGAQLTASNTSSLQRGGSVNIQGVDRLTVRSGGQISAETDTGVAGSVQVNAADGTVQLTGENTRLTARANQSGGDAGNVAITARNLTVRDGAQVTAATQTGTAGNVRVNAAGGTVQLIGENTRLTARANRPGGDAGSVAITAGNLTIRDGAQVTATTQTGTAGNVTVNAENGRVLLSGANTRLSARSNNGSAGSVAITTRNLTVRDGAQVTAETQTGRAGSVTVNAENGRVLLSGANTLLSARANDGRAGNVDITARDLRVQDGASVTVSSEQGPAGNLNITTGTVTLDHGFLSAIAGTGDNGNIVLTMTGRLLQLNNGSEISARALNSGDGGRITLNVLNGFVLTNYLDDNDIIASASGTGNGGSVQINALGIFGLQERATDTQYSDIVVSSRFGTTGTIELNTLGIDPTRGLSELPTTVEPPTQVARGCGTSSEAIASAQGSFVVRGRGGLPSTPGDVLNSEPVGDDWVAFDETIEAESVTVPPNSEPQPLTEIVEAQGWIVNEKGEVEIVATVPTSTPQTAALSTPTCSVNPS
jgi:filamentous hemagglutinin family protein